MPAGRPSDYRPEYCEKVIALGKEGASVVRMACEIGVDRTTLERDWPSSKPEFSLALEMAKMHSQAVWEQKGIDLINEKASSGQASIWSRSMAARFPKDWRENSKHEVSGPDGAAIPVAVTVSYVDPDAKSA